MVAMQAHEITPFEAAAKGSNPFGCIVVLLQIRLSESENPFLSAKNT